MPGPAASIDLSTLPQPILVRLLQDATKARDRELIVRLLALIRPMSFVCYPFTEYNARVAAGLPT